jgi:predicted ester cyclase
MNETTQENKALIRSIYEDLWNKADPAFASRIFAQPQGVERFVREFLAAFPDLQHTVEAIILQADQAVARFSARGTHQGKWKEFEATGKEVRYTGVTIIRVEDAMIVEHHTWWDEYGLIRQITGTE